MLAATAGGGPGEAKSLPWSILVEGFHASAYTIEERVLVSSARLSGLVQRARGEAHLEKADAERAVVVHVRVVAPRNLRGSPSQPLVGESFGRGSVTHELDLLAIRAGRGERGCQLACAGLGQVVRTRPIY